jgi:hypothetical protein
MSASCGVSKDGRTTCEVLEHGAARAEHRHAKHVLARTRGHNAHAVARCRSSPRERALLVVPHVPMSARPPSTDDTSTRSLGQPAGRAREKRARSALRSSLHRGDPCKQAKRRWGGSTARGRCPERQQGWCTGKRAAWRFGRERTSACTAVHVRPAGVPFVTLQPSLETRNFARGEPTAIFGDTGLCKDARARARTARPA